MSLVPYRRWCLCLRTVCSSLLPSVLPNANAFVSYENWNTAAPFVSHCADVTAATANGLAPAAAAVLAGLEIHSLGAGSCRARRREVYPWRTGQGLGSDLLRYHVRVVDDERPTQERRLPGAPDAQCGVGARVVAARARRDALTWRTEVMPRPPLACRCRSRCARRGALLRSSSCS